MLVVFGSMTYDGKHYVRAGWVGNVDDIFPLGDEMQEVAERRRQREEAKQQQEA